MSAGGGQRWRRAPRGATIRGSDILRTRRGRRDERGPVDARNEDLLDIAVIGPSRFPIREPYAGGLEVVVAK